MALRVLNYITMDDPDVVIDETVVDEECITGVAGDVGVTRIITRVAARADVKYVYTILEEMERSARVRGTGIARRTPQSICQKIYDGKAVIAVTAGGDWVGFSYIEAWSGGQFVSNSGLIVNPAYRGGGVATVIKNHIFRLSCSRYPAAKVFSITTGEAVKKMNTRLGFQPVSYSEITRDEKFWDQCRQCVNYSKLQSESRQRCLCTAMLYDPRQDGITKTSITLKKVFSK